MFAVIMIPVITSIFLSVLYRRELHLRRKSERMYRELIGRSKYNRPNPFNSTIKEYESKKPQNESSRIN